MKKNISLSNNCIIVGCALQTPITYLDGQFVVWQYPVEDKVFKRSYSIYNSYATSDGGRYVEFHIKRVPGGIVSNHIIDNAMIGDSFDLIGGVGKMTLTEANSYIFIGIGSGLSPLHALFDGLIHNNFEGRIGILYGERFYSDLISECINSFPENSHKVMKKICLSQEKVEGYGFGRIQQHLDEILSFATKDSQVYICGKPEMVDDVVVRLIEIGLDKTNIHFEKF